MQFGGVSGDEMRDGEVSLYGDEMCVKIFRCSDGWEMRVNEMDG